jgi:hypothetical protein
MEDYHYRLDIKFLLLDDKKRNMGWMWAGKQETEYRGLPLQIGH